MVDATQIRPLIQTYAMAVQDALQSAYSFMDEALRPTVAVETGRKYAKLVADHGHQRMVHSFVNLTTGAVLKAESWNKPAKGERYNVVTGLDTLLGAVDPYGSYLYQR